MKTSQTDIKDFDRPLNKIGLKEAKLMAKQLSEEKFLPHLIISSGANRALTTSKIIAKIIGYSEQDIEINNSIYHSSHDNVIDIIHGVPDSYAKLMIAGHNPTLHYLSQILTGEQVLSFPTCSVFCIQFDVEHWNQIDDYVDKIKKY